MPKKVTEASIWESSLGLMLKGSMKRKTTVYIHIYIYFFFPHIFTYLFLLRLLSNLIFSYSLSTGKNQRLVFEYPTVIT